MPEEVHNTDRFIKLSEHAEYCAVKRLREVVKLKLRTPRKLFTLKVNPTEAEGIIKKLRCEIIEV